MEGVRGRVTYRVIPRALVVHVVRGHILLENGGAAAGEHHAAQGGAACARARRQNRLGAFYRGLHEKALAQLRRPRRDNKGARRVKYNTAARNSGVKCRAIAQQVRLKKNQTLRRARQNLEVRRLRNGAHRAVHTQAARKQGRNELAGDKSRGASNAN